MCRQKCLTLYKCSTSNKTMDYGFRKNCIAITNLCLKRTPSPMIKKEIITEVLPHPFYSIDLLIVIFDWIMLSRKHKMDAVLKSRHAAKKACFPVSFKIYNHDVILRRYGIVANIKMRYPKKPYNYNVSWRLHWYFHRFTLITV